MLWIEYSQGDMNINEWEKTLNCHAYNSDNSDCKLLTNLKQHVFTYNIMISP